ncbi:glycerol kinase [Allokutzneria albata]|uniref:ATP:glycerol 3-phosphotransferase n=1 Tax=Allokutzneria albata TaxID=211114 RepID=A0A1G9S3Q0_ALLAB|nr:glycerol kinase [Allokutzneria albata]
MILGVDVGTHACRAVAVGPDGAVLRSVQRPLTLRTPHPGWAEMDPHEIVSATDAVVREAASWGPVAAIGLTTMRESTILWDRATGAPLHEAILWMSRQSEGYTDAWLAAGLEPEVHRRTGVALHPRFSASKIAWLLDHIPGARLRAERGELAAGTVDSWLLSRLTGEPHQTDYTNACGTMLFNLHTREWDAELCQWFGIPLELLPVVRPSVHDFGTVRGEVPVLAVLGDQQASLFGQACFTPGAVKYTFGTSGVLTLNSGPNPKLHKGFTAGVAWGLSTDEISFEIEGAVPHSGHALQWLHDRMGLVRDLRSLDVAEDNGGVYVVPAFTGLGAPSWDATARGAILGLGLDTRPEHIARAAVESLAYQVRDSVEALTTEPISPEVRVDGGAARYDVLCQFLADILGREVLRPPTVEMTAVGVAHLAGLATGMWSSTEELSELWRAERRFTPAMSADHRDALYGGWRQACARVGGFEAPARSTRRPLQRRP